MIKNLAHLAKTGLRCRKPTLKSLKNPSILQRAQITTPKLTLHKPFSSSPKPTSNLENDTQRTKTNPDTTQNSSHQAQNNQETQKIENQPNPEKMNFNREIWDIGPQNKDKAVAMKDMIGYNEKFFKDSVTLYFYAGNGGFGAISHEPSRIRKKGRPIGGDGGKGGDIYLKAVKTNPDFSYIRSKHIRGNKGKDGKNNGSHGKDGKSLYYGVPVGTAAYEISHKEVLDEDGKIVKKTKKNLIGELNEMNEELLVVKGGRGSLGNLNNTRLTERIPGFGGQAKKVRLESRMLADIGLIGYPNAGKSTLISSITRSKPKIASYAFTTLTPNLGQINFIDNKNVTIADIPGLIEGSSENKGLGHRFLAHCVKAKALAYVIDMSTEQTVSPWDQYYNLRNELLAFDRGFEEKEEVIVGTKGDLVGTEAARLQFERVVGKGVIMVSAMENVNLSMLVRRFRDLVYGDAEDGPDVFNKGR